MLAGPLLHFMAANIYIIIYIGNNCNVFCCNNHRRSPSKHRIRLTVRIATCGYLSLYKFGSPTCQSYHTVERSSETVFNTERAV